MATETNEIRSTLNGLIETLKDGETGFQTSAQKLKDSGARTQFLQYAGERAGFAGELQQEVIRIGGEAATSGSTAGALHRGWIDLKAALAGDSDHAVLAEAERGEDAAVKNYRDALSKDLPSDIRNIIDSQYKTILATHSQVKALRDAAEAGNTASGAPRAY